MKQLIEKFKKENPIPNIYILISTSVMVRCGILMLMWKR